MTVTATRAIISLRQHVHRPREEQIKDRITQMECGSFVPIGEKFITESGFTTTTFNITIDAALVSRFSLKPGKRNQA